MTPSSAASVTSSSEAPTSSPVKLRTALAPLLPSAPARTDGRDACAPARVARRSGGSGRAWSAGARCRARRPPASSARADRSAAAVTRSHISSVTPSGWSMNTRRQRPPSDLGEQHLDIGLAVGETPLDFCLQRCHRVFILTPYAKKAGGRPLSVLLPTPARRHESCRSRIASAGLRIASSGAFPLRCGVAPGAIAVEPVVGALGRSEHASASGWQASRWRPSSCIERPRQNSA